MMNLNIYLSIYMFLFSCFMFSYYYNHLLLTIISLEFIMISVYYNMFLILNILENNLYSMFIFLSMVVCEGGLGLSLIVLMVRSYGNDYLNSINLLKW